MPDQPTEWYRDQSMSFLEARDYISALVHEYGQKTPQRVALQRSALGRVIAENACAQLPIPRHDRAVMDGVAMHSQDQELSQPLPVAFASVAGAAQQQLPKNMVARITTGAVLPVGADTVIPKEAVRLQGNALTSISGPFHAGQYVRHAGSDYAIGDVVVPSGRRLGLRECAVLREAGLEWVNVYPQLSVGVLSTGDEIVPVFHESIEDNITVDLNGEIITSALRHLGWEVEHQIVPDRAADLANHLSEMQHRHDVIMTIGGASVGERDGVRHYLARNGQIGIDRVWMQPGKPFMQARLGDALLFALPGNPGSSLVTFAMLVLPKLRALEGEQISQQPISGHMAEPLQLNGSRYQFRSCHTEIIDGRLWINPSAVMASASLRNLQNSDGLIALAPEQRNLARGDSVDYYSWQSLIPGFLSS